MLLDIFLFFIVSIIATIPLCLLLFAKAIVLTPFAWLATRKNKSLKTIGCMFIIILGLPLRVIVCLIWGGGHALYATMLVHEHSTGWLIYPLGALFCFSAFTWLDQREIASNPDHTPQKSRWIKIITLVIYITVCIYPEAILLISVK